MSAGGPGSGGQSPDRGRGEAGQATVELALCLPVIVLLLLLVVQLGLLARDRVLVVHAAREAAREAAVGGDPGAVRSAARSEGLRPERVRVSRTDRPDGTVAVEVRYTAPTDLPIVGRLVPDPTFEATVVMRRETDGTEP